MGNILRLMANNKLILIIAFGLSGFLCAKKLYIQINTPDVDYLNDKIIKKINEKISDIKDITKNLNEQIQQIEDYNKYRN